MVVEEYGAGCSGSLSGGSGGRVCGLGSGAEHNESALGTNLDARSVGVGSVHGWLVSRDAPKQTVDFMKLWLEKDIQTKFCRSLSTPIELGWLR
jgi:hypothetical protein